MEDWVREWYVSDGEAFLDDLSEEGQFCLDGDLGVLAAHAHRSALLLKHANIINGAEAQDINIGYSGPQEAEVNQKRGELIEMLLEK